MSISTVDLILAGMQPTQNLRKVSNTSTMKGSRVSTWLMNGWPGAAVACAAGINGEAVSFPWGGAIAFPTIGGSNHCYLERAFLSTTFSASLGLGSLADRLWQNSGISVTTTTAQAISAGFSGKSVTWPARDRDGLGAGFGVLVGLEVTGTLGLGSANTAATINYTNTAGTTGRTGTLASPGIPIAAATNTFIPFELQAGDMGIASVEGVTLSTSLVSGTVQLIAYREVASFGAQLNRGQGIDPVTGGMPELYAGSACFWMWLSDAVSLLPQWNGQIAFTVG